MSLQNEQSKSCHEGCTCISRGAISISCCHCTLNPREISSIPRDKIGGNVQISKENIGFLLTICLFDARAALADLSCFQEMVASENNG